MKKKSKMSQKCCELELKFFNIESKIKKKKVNVNNLEISENKNIIINISFCQFWFRNVKIFGRKRK